LITGIVEQNNKTEMS